MKKIGIILLCFVMVLSLLACANTSGGSQTTQATDSADQVAAFSGLCPRFQESDPIFATHHRIRKAAPKWVLLFIVKEVPGFLPEWEHCLCHRVGW